MREQHDVAGQQLARRLAARRQPGRARGHGVKRGAADAGRPPAPARAGLDPRAERLRHRRASTASHPCRQYQRQQLLERGAAKVYARGARPAHDSDLRAASRPLRARHHRPRRRLDAPTGRRSGARTDVHLLINNAGVSTGTDLVTGDLDRIRLELDTNLYGTLAMVRAFAPGAARRRDPQRAQPPLVAVLPGRERLRRLQGRGLEPDQRHPARAGAPGHARHRRVPEQHGHRHDGRLRHPQERPRGRRAPGAGRHRGGATEVIADADTAAAKLQLSA